MSVCFCKVCGKQIDRDVDDHEHLTFSAIRMDESQNDGEPDFTLDDLEWSEEYE